MHILYYLLLLIVMGLGLFLNILGLPGLWLVVAAHGIYALTTGWNVYVGWASLATLVVLALIAEALEFFAGAAGSKAAGGRTRGAIGAIVGAFVGAIFLSIVPIPIVAQVVGACLGAFIGAAIMEFTDKDLQHSLRVGYGAAKGRFWGILSKSAVGVVMFFVAAVAAWPMRVVVTKTQVFPPPGSTPVTMPTTMPTTESTSMPATVPTTLP
jgi:uncharacterized protein YqgC (DUF456 family)